MIHWGDQSIYLRKKKGKDEKNEKEPCWGVGGRGLWAPREARLQLALLPSITGEGFWQALMAASGSLNVT